MLVRFDLQAQLRTVAGTSRVDLTLPDSASLADAIAHLCQHLGPQSEPHLLTASKSPRPSLIMMVNGAPVFSEEAATFALPEGTEILLLPPIAGG